MLLKKLDCIRTSAAGFALNHKIVGWVEFTQPGGQFAQRNQDRTGDAGDVPLEGFTDIDEDKILIPVQAGFEVLHSDFRDIGIHGF